MNELTAKPQNWEAFLKLELRCGQEKTHLVPIKRYGPLTVQRPFYPEQACCHVYLLHPPGGIVGGDRLDLQVVSEENSNGLMTTPGAAKYYLSAGDTAYVTQQFEVASGAHLEFLPQENIYFPGAQVSSKTSIDVASGSRFMLWEKHCFGRPANNELFSSGQLNSKIEVRHEGRLLFTEIQRVNANELVRAITLLWAVF
jgi:urease accessory protein